MRLRTRGSGFTLIELLVVVAVIALLIGLLVPAVQRARAAAARGHCQNNLKQIGLACQSFHDGQKRFPSSYVATEPYKDGASDTSPGWGWSAFLLPYLEQSNLFQTIQFASPVESPKNATAMGTVL